MKLQKLLYFAHGWHLALTGRPLLLECIQAWRFGPVINSIYHEFKRFGNRKIEVLATSLDLETMEEFEAHANFDDTPLQIMDMVWDEYHSAHPVALSQLTHEQGSPWDLVAGEYRRDRIPLPMHLTISDDEIRRYFQSVLNVNQGLEAHGA